jgi:predicted dehydrogenase
MKNIAIIGLGHVTSYQIEALQNIPDKYRIIALCDKDKSRLNSYEWIDCVLMENYEDLFELSNLDVVLISLPNSMHYDVSKQFLEKKIHVIVEKPAVLEYDKLENLYDISNINKSDLYVAFHARYAPDLLYFLDNKKNILDKYNLGDLVGFSCNFFDPYYEVNSLEATVQKLESLSSSWIDSGVNALSVVYSLFENVDILSVHQSEIGLGKNSISKLASSVDFLIKLEKGNIGRGTINTNWTNQKNYKETNLFFENSNGYIKLHHSKQQVQYICNGRIDLVRDFSKSRERLVNHYLNLFNDYANINDCIAENTVLARRVHNTLLKIK